MSVANKCACKRTFRPRSNYRSPKGSALSELGRVLDQASWRDSLLRVLTAWNRHQVWRHVTRIQRSRRWVTPLERLGSTPPSADSQQRAQLF